MKHFVTIQTGFSDRLLLLAMVFLFAGCGLNFDIQKRQHQPGIYFNMDVDKPSDIDKPKASDSGSINTISRPDSTLSGYRSTEQFKIYRNKHSYFAEPYAKAPKSSENEVEIKWNAAKTDEPLFAEDQRTLFNEQDTTETEPDVNEELTAEDDVDARVRNHETALLLAFILGLFGIHRFYLGYYWTGILQLLLGALVLIALGYIIVALFLGILSIEILRSISVDLLLFFLPFLIIVIAVVLILGFLIVNGALNWLISDIRNIRSGEMKPKDGYYRDYDDSGGK